MYVYNGETTADISIYIYNGGYIGVRLQKQKMLLVFI